MPRWMGIDWFFRVDYFDLQAASVAPTYFGLDFKTGGVRNVVLDDQTLQLDISWDLLLVADGTDLKAYDSGFSELDIQFSDRVLDRHIDFISFGIPANALSGMVRCEFFTTGPDTTTRRCQQRRFFTCG